MEQPLNSTPAVLQIPIAKIRPNANNPRRVIKPGKVEKLATSMKAVGQETPIKVRSLKATVQKCESAKVESSSDPTDASSPQGSDLQAAQTPTEFEYELTDSIRPESNSGAPSPLAQTYEFELVGGHIRLEAAKSLGWETLSALLLEVSGDQAELAAVLDNRGEDMHWLDWYQAIERRYSATPKPTQQRIANELGFSQAKVSLALKVVELLNPASRQAIYYDVINGVDDGPSEMAVRRLTDLEDPQKVESALKVVIDQKLTEPQARDLVDWVKLGNDPATFNFTLGKMPDGSKVPGREQLSGTEVASSSSPAYSAGTPRNDSQLNSKDPNAPYWQPLPPNVNIRKSSKGYRVTMVLSLAEGPVAVYGAMANLEHTKALAGETEDAQYKDALQKICADGAAEWILEKGKEKAKLKSVKVQKFESSIAKPVSRVQDEGGNEPAENQQPEILTSATAPTDSTSSPQVGAPPQDDSKSKQPQDNGNETTPAASGGLLGQLHGAVKGYLKDLPGSLSDSLLKDGKQAVNYEIRKGMRNVIKDIFNGN